MREEHDAPLLIGAFRKESTRTLLALEAHAAQQSLT
jgi:hypothetical protein